MIVNLLAVVFYAILNLALASRDAYKIEQGEKIQHGLNALEYLVFLIPAYAITHSWFFIIGLLSLRKVVFDLSLNYMRGLPIDYYSSTTTSKIDKLTYDLHKKYGWKLFYGAFLLITLLSIIPYGKI